MTRLLAAVGVVSLAMWAVAAWLLRELVKAVEHP